ncbi:hypothetical protein CN918_32715 [Priestia megaterium]|nr:hypothetical protein CN918_32715 [Priestia megaterium]
MDKITILSNIKNLTFSSDLSQIFSILESNLDKVEFTKDYVGLRDFLYLAEDQADDSEYPFFGFFDFSEKNSFEDSGVYNEVVYDIPEICKKLTYFFKTCNRPIYISIGFKDSTLTSEDMLYIHNMIEHDVIKDRNEGESRLRKFPEWYVAKYPNEILEDVELVELLEAIRTRETQLTAQLKHHIYYQIDKALDSNDKQSFLELTKKLVKM